MNIVISHLCVIIILLPYCYFYNFRNDDIDLTIYILKTLVKPLIEQNYQALERVCVVPSGYPHVHQFKGFSFVVFLFFLIDYIVRIVYTSLFGGPV